MKNKLSLSSKIIIHIYKKGYRTDGINVYSPNGKCRKLSIKQGIYLTFNIRHLGTILPIRVHRFVAYHKFGMDMFKSGIEVRHSNGNSLDNSFANIKLGTRSENELDKPIEVRLRVANYATSFAKKHNHELIINMHVAGNSYGQIMEATGIKSKGTISFIINKSMANKSESLSRIELPSES